MNITLIRNGMRAIGATGLAVAALGITSAAAAGNFNFSDFVNQTGPFSLVSNTHTVSDTTSTNLSRVATANTPASLSISLPTLDIIGNTTVGSASQGSSTVMGGISNNLNGGGGSSLILPDNGLGTVSVTSNTSNTGPSSSVNNNTNITHSSTTNLTDTATINAPVSANVSAGPITVANNTTVGLVSGGNQSFSANVNNTANSSMPIMTANSTPTSVSVGNTVNTTGPGSVVNNVANINSSDTLNITRTGTVTSPFSFTSTAGPVNITGNTSVAGFQGGNQSVNFTETNSVN